MLQAEQLRQRTKQFALAVLGLVRDLPRTDEARVLGKQLLRSGTSLAANYRAACRARSKAEFISKMSVVIEETDETDFGWNYRRKAGWLLLRERRSCCVKSVNCWPSSSPHDGPRGEKEERNDMIDDSQNCHDW